MATIKTLGDWSSDAVFKYLLPNTDAKFNAVKRAGASLYL
jgi:hypothetical protein